MVEKKDNATGKGRKGTFLWGMSLMPVLDFSSAVVITYQRMGVVPGHPNNWRIVLKGSHLQPVVTKRDLQERSEIRCPQIGGNQWSASQFSTLLYFTIFIWLFFIYLHPFLCISWYGTYMFISPRKTISGIPLSSIVFSWLRNVTKRILSYLSNVSTRDCIQATLSKEGYLRANPAKT